jgi:hypothetical protein
VVLAKLHKAIFAIALFGTVTSLSIGLGEVFSASNGPMIADPAKGLVVPFNDHGTTVYISRVQDAWLNGAWWVYFPCFIYAWISIAYPKWRKWRDAGGTKI